MSDALRQKAIAALRHYFTETDLWRYRFGFGDAYNLDPPLLVFVVGLGVLLLQ